MANNNRTEENIELIRGDPKRAIRKLSVPTMMSMLILMIYNLADSLWVAGLEPTHLQQSVSSHRSFS